MLVVYVALERRCVSVCEQWRGTRREKGEKGGKGEPGKEGRKSTSHPQSQAPFSVSFFNNAAVSKYALLIMCKA